MDNVGIRPIIERFLLPNHLFALEFREGFVFGRVVRRRICQYKPYPLIDSDGTAIDIAPESHQDEVWFRDPRNTKNDILFLDSATNSGYPWFFHGSIGIKPQYIRMYPRLPSGKDFPGKFPNIDPIRPSDGDAVGYVNSLNSPYENPTDFVEYVIVPNIHLGAEFYNTDTDRSHQPVLNLLFALYWVQLFPPDKPIVKKIANREVPAAFLTVGFGNVPIEYGRLRQDWGVDPIKLEEVL